jgi:hypothetical protein
MAAKAWIVALRWASCRRSLAMLGFFVKRQLIAGIQDTLVNHGL